jgi:tetratricopeptide (TPR) repeat protein
MHLLKNRIVISILIIICGIYVWEFFIKPVTGPIYTEAVAEYKRGNYIRSLELLDRAERIDPNDAAILALKGWNHLKRGDPKTAEEPYFRRAYELAPNVEDITLGYAYAEIALGKFEQARRLLDRLRKAGVDTPDMLVAQGALFREQGQYREAAQQFQLALSRDPHNELAAKNLRELLNVSGDVRNVSVEFPPYQRPAQLQVPFRAQGDFFQRRAGSNWEPVYLAGVTLSGAMPGYYPSDSSVDPAEFGRWLNQIGDLGANSIRVYSIMPPAFYRMLAEYNKAHASRPLYLIQGVGCGDPPRDDMFDSKYYEQCRKNIRNMIDVIHGRGDVAAGNGHAGGVFTTDVATWVAGLLVGDPWLSHVVTANNLLHPDIQKYEGAYIEVPQGTATEIFLAQMINYAMEYEEGSYNWQHPVAFVNWPTLDPLRHPTESTILEEVAIRRAQGERLPTPSGPFDDDDGVSVDPMKLRPREKFVAGYFASYSVLPYYPDFLNQDPRYQAIRDAEGSNPFLGYLTDLKGHHEGIPLLVAEYGIPTGMGIAHFSPAGFDEGGKTETQQGQILVRLSRSVRESGAAGGMIFEWVDQWFRQSWVQRDYEMPADRRVLWTNAMNPAEHFGLLAADPSGREKHNLTGNPEAWSDSKPWYAEAKPGPTVPVGDKYDPGRDLKALYLDADEAFLYIRLAVGKLDNDNDGQPDWGQTNYLIGLGTAPQVGGLAYLPFIIPIRFPLGMTYAVQLAGPSSARIWIASSYNPFRIAQVEGIPSQTTLSSKLGWRASVSPSGTFESQIMEPNRRRYSRDGRYFPPQRYERGILRSGSLNPAASDYDTLAQWHANLPSNTVDLRIPWSLLGVTDPSSYKIVAGLERDGTVVTTDTPGFSIVAFSYRPLDSARTRPIMEQSHPVSDALPDLTGPGSLPASAIKPYRWNGWSVPHYKLRLKDSYAILRKVMPSLTAPPSPSAPGAVGPSGRRSAAPAGR